MLYCVCACACCGVVCVYLGWPSRRVNVVLCVCRWQRTIAPVVRVALRRLGAGVVARLVAGEAEALVIVRSTPPTAQRRVLPDGRHKHTTPPHIRKGCEKAKYGLLITRQAEQLVAEEQAALSHSWEEIWSSLLLVGSVARLVGRLPRHSAAAKRTTTNEETSLASIPISLLSLSFSCCSGSTVCRLHTKVVPNFGGGGRLLVSCLSHHNLIWGSVASLLLFCFFLFFFYFSTTLLFRFADSVARCHSQTFAVKKKTKTKSDDNSFR